MRLIDEEYAIRTFIDAEIDLDRVYPNGNGNNTFEDGVNCGLENACSLLSKCPTINPLQEILNAIRELKRSPWFNEGQYRDRGTYLTRKEALEIVETLVVKEVMHKYE